MIRSLGFQLGAVLACVTAAIGWLKLHDKKIEKQVTTEIVQRSEKTGAQNAAKSAKAHDSARKPGAVDRLRADPQTCVDCK